MPRPRAEPRQGRRVRDSPSWRSPRPGTRRPDSSCSPATSATASNGTVEPSDPEFTRVQGTTLMFSRLLHRHQWRYPLRHLPRPASQPRHHAVPLRRQMPGLSYPVGVQARPIAIGPFRRGQASPLQPEICPVNPATDCTSCHMPKIPGPLPPHRVHRPPHSHPSPARRMTDGWRVAGKYWYALQSDEISDPSPRPVSTMQRAEDQPTRHPPLATRHPASVERTIRHPPPAPASGGPDPGDGGRGGRSVFRLRSVSALPPDRIGPAVVHRASL